jgi:UDPglucose 6-dehydrogenase
MQGPLLIATKSTVPVGTGAELRHLITSMARFPFSIVSNPEFLKEGTAIADCMKPDRIIIGCDDREAEEVMRRLYAPFTMRDNRILVMDIASAELTKYAANAMLATRISFMNELSNLCNEMGADIRQVRLGIGSDRRIGLDFLYAGVGYGGSCFPKDVQALIHMCESRGLSAGIPRAVEAANERQRRTFAALITERLGTLEGKRIAIWGLTFKPGTDDMRASPALDIIEALRGAELAIYDPVADYPGLCSSEYEAAEGADAIVLMTEWKQFRFVDLNRVRNSMRGDLFFDGRNQYDLAEMEEKGFSYYGIGIPCSKTASPA